MSRYVMSDIHGCYDRFMQMLDLINFNDKDELYIIGDIIDRGDKPIEIFEYILTHKNIKLLKGNHEDMACNYQLDGDLSLWMMNGGNTTFYEMLMKPDINYLDNFCNYIKRLPSIMVVGKYILVHAGLTFPKNYNDLSLQEFLDLQDKEECLWDRTHIGNEKQFKDYTIICGHTPVQNIEHNKEVKIIHRLGHIYIDCGCYFEKANGKLACLRLDDLKEFYI